MKKTTKNKLANSKLTRQNFQFCLRYLLIRFSNRKIKLGQFSRALGLLKSCLNFFVTYNFHSFRHPPPPPPPPHLPRPISLSFGALQVFAWKRQNFGFMRGTNCLNADATYGTVPENRRRYYGRGFLCMPHGAVERSRRARMLNNEDYR